MMKYLVRYPLLIITACLVCVLNGVSMAQSQTCPDGMVCISQAAANAAASNARELAATRDKVTVLESALIDKDKSISEVQLTAAKNEADLKAAIVKTQTELATAIGQLIEAKADKIMYIKLIEYLTKNQRSKQNGLFNIKIGGN